MKIFLIGFMASGKTTLGGELASLLGCRFIDMDWYIETKSGLTIKQLFEAKGETYFRSVESESLREIISITDDLVVSTGGGTSCFYGNIDVMNSAGLTVYLRMEVGTLLARLIESKVDRPLLWGKSKDELNDYIIRVLNERKRYYEKAQLIVDADNLTPTELAAVIRSMGNI